MSILKVIPYYGFILILCHVTFKVKVTELDHMNHNALSKLSKMSLLKFSLFFFEQKITLDINRMWKKRLEKSCIRFSIQGKISINTLKKFF